MARGSRVVDEFNVVQDVQDIYISYGDKSMQVGEGYVADAGVIRQFWPPDVVPQTGIVMDSIADESYDIDPATAKAVCNYDCRTGILTLSDGTGTKQIQAINPAPRGQGSYLYKFEVVSGDIVTHDFETPSTPGDPNFDDVALLVHGNGTDASTSFPDSSNNIHVLTAGGNAQVDTAEKKFGTGSILFDGASHITLPNDASFAFGTGNFTIEFWCNFSVAQNDKMIFDFRAAGANSPALIVTTGGAGGTTAGSLRYEGSAVVHSGTNLIDDGTWHHCAIVRDGTDIELFIDGVSVGTGTDTNNYTATGNTLYIGRNSYAAAGHITGWLDDIRITKNVARYTTAFTPPTAEFPDVDGPAASDWHDVLEEGTIAVYENYLESTNIGVVTGQGIISFAQDNGSGGPAAGTTVSKTIDFKSEVLSDRITMSTAPWNLSNTEVNETAEVAIVVVPDGWYDPVNEVNLEYPVITGEFGHPKGIQVFEIYASNWDSNITVQVDVVSGSVSGSATGVPLSTGERRIWSIAADSVGSVSATVDVTISDGVETVTKRVTMYAEQVSEGVDSGISDEWTRTDAVHDEDIGGVSLETEIHIYFNPDGTLDVTTLHGGHQFTQDWNTDAPAVPDPQNYEVRGYFSQTDSLWPSTLESEELWFNKWHNLSQQRVWGSRDTSSASQGTVTKSGTWTFAIREVGRPDTVKYKRLNVSIKMVH